MTHIWVRAEERPHEQRVGLTPEGARELLRRGFAVTVEESRQRAIPIDAYREAGAEIAPEGSWREAPADAFIFGLKELSDDGSPLTHRHIMFGHAYKGQPAGRRLLERFRAGGGRLYDLEYLTDETGRRVAAFGYWAGFAGAAVALWAWAAQAQGGILGPVGVAGSAEALVRDTQARLDSAAVQRPRAIVIGALGRVGTGASDLCKAVGVETTRWDIAETAHGGPFPEILEHEVFLNCILARPGCPVFVPADAVTASRRLTVIGDIACDPESDFSPIKVYDRVTTWEEPVLRVHQAPPLDVTAIDNLPSLLPRESSEDFAAQLLPHLATLDRIDEGVWARAAAEFERHVQALGAEKETQA
ncbi:saccharopine dehydrogenase (NAD+, L-lysine forming) [Meinhardsimonia xiamenensis]|jgi:saccharopine dehydrogenase (NAD+, L-lysine-forming)|uniref:Saccharopine dehydrogenase [NAD(+), L-lysine-forming] n=1 Tax=Meinhardsimonia xiamenensis TaxID=990712 RepID=A0A1G8Z5E6_9RHOB|nr:saccharopine dehydrogenase [Meinhardsimonia xiamenensis]PRX37533.1 saccharopine dehydrogenase (NAD+, L-lysine-forming) [Meinhardsimonia xiamenensis]SDK09470.1 saccharopine dehydrogenase (NAD+, L-lysine forming) [Meinhardsimonia xiamenensis]